MIPARRKYPNETRTLSFDFSEKLNPGDSVASLDSFSGGGLSAATPTVVDNLVSMQVSGGATGTDYVTYVRVNTTQLDKLQLDCRVEVREDAN